MAGPLALRFLCIENLARWARLGKLLGRWPEERLNSQLQNALARDREKIEIPLLTLRVVMKVQLENIRLGRAIEQDTSCSDNLPSFSDQYRHCGRCDGRRQRPRR